VIDEFFDVQFDGWLRQLRDGDGRALGEHRAGPDPDGAVSLRTCPYPGSRKDHARPMNVAALEQVTRLWRGTLGTASVLRARHLERHPRARFGLPDFYQVARSATLLPAYLARRVDRPSGPGVLSTELAVLYKVMIGYVGVAHGLAVDQVLQYDVDWPTATVDEVYEFAERRDYFIGRHEVCAGPAPMVREALAVMLDGQAGRGRQAADLGLDDGELERALNYADRVVQLELVKALWMLEVRDGRDRLVAHLRGAGGLADALAAERSAAERIEVPTMTMSWSFDGLEVAEPAEAHRECRRRAARYLGSCAAALGPLPDAARDLFDLLASEPEESGPNEEDPVARADILIEAGRRRSVAVPDPEGLSALVGRYTARESAGRAAFDELRRQVVEALGRAGSAAPLHSADLAQVFGPSVRDLVLACLDLPKAGA
jgi:hypothetical protein